MVNNFEWYRALLGGLWYKIGNLINEEYQYY